MGLTFVCCGVDDVIDVVIDVGFDAGCGADVGFECDGSSIDVVAP